ncbi:MAG: glyoxalase superfamily protein [Streptosporangiaceae bacterium]
MEAEVVPVLRVADAAATVAWYERLGFTEQWVHRVEPGCPAFVSIVRDRARLFLSEHHGDARPDTLVHLFVSDVEGRGRVRPARRRTSVWVRARTSRSGW